MQDHDAAEDLMGQSQRACCLQVSQLVNEEGHVWDSAAAIGILCG
jgi:hypothetical protein